MSTKIQLPWIKKDVGLGDLLQEMVDPTHKYQNCQKCRERQRKLNSLITFTGSPVTQPPQPRPRPSDWRQQYGAVSEDDLPDGEGE